MASFIAGGRTYTKSKRSETDWTQHCVGVALCGCTSEHMNFADSVTQDELKGFAPSEFTAFLAAAK